MSGRLLNGWGECVWCGEMLKPEDSDPTNNYCEFCKKWNELIGLVIDRKFLAEKMMKEYENNAKALAYWRNKLETYEAIHKTLIDILNLKKHDLFGEAY